MYQPTRCCLIRVSVCGHLDYWSPLSHFGSTGRQKAESSRVAFCQPFCLVCGPVAGPPPPPLSHFGRSGRKLCPILGAQVESSKEAFCQPSRKQQGGILPTLPFALCVITSLFLCPILGAQGQRKQQGGILPTHLPFVLSYFFTIPCPILGDQEGRPAEALCLMC